MSDGFIGFGLTINPTTLTGLNIEAIEAAVAAQQDVFLAKIDDIDPAGLIENSYAIDAGSEEAQAELRQGLVEAVTAGVAWLKENWETQGVFTVPGDKGYKFIAGGGVTWGDSPFDEYDSVVLAANAADAVPEFGQAVGLVGGGIAA